MREFENLNDVLDFAIKAEQDSVDFYNQLSATLKNKEMQEVFAGFAREEIGHKVKLLKVKEEGRFSSEPANIQDLKIADYLTPIKPTEDINYPEALIIAILKEKAAYKLYSALVERVQSDDLKNVFANLAQEESKHKLKFEIEYDELINKEN